MYGVNDLLFYIKCLMLQGSISLFSCFALTKDISGYQVTTLQSCWYMIAKYFKLNVFFHVLIHDIYNKYGIRNPKSFTFQNVCLHSDILYGL